MKRGKKYIEAAKLIERGNLYDPAEAVALVKKSATAKFDETIEAHLTDIFKIFHEFFSFFFLKIDSDLYDCIIVCHFS